MHCALFIIIFQRRLTSSIHRDESDQNANRRLEPDELIFNCRVTQVV